MLNCRILCMAHVLIMLLVITPRVSFAETEASKSALVVLSPLGNSKAQGILTLESELDGLRIRGQITGLTPGKHGMHIHEFGNCAQPDGKSAGTHFSSEPGEHGGPKAKERHTGDLGNIIADENGSAFIDIKERYSSLNGARSVIGRSLVIHANEDDFKTQPAGDSGSRLACGVIGLTEAKG